MAQINELYTLLRKCKGNACELTHPGWKILKHIAKSCPVITHLMPSKMYRVDDQFESLTISYQSIFHRKLRPTHLFIYADGRIEFNAYSRKPYFKQLLASIADSLK